jgi:hypothetical protein
LSTAACCCAGVRGPTPFSCCGGRPIRRTAPSLTAAASSAVSNCPRLTVPAAGTFTQLRNLFQEGPTPM